MSSFSPKALDDMLNRCVTNYASPEGEITAAAAAAKAAYDVPSIPTTDIERVIAAERAIREKTESLEARFTAPIAKSPQISGKKRIAPKLLFAQPSPPSPKANTSAAAAAAAAGAADEDDKPSPKPTLIIPDEPKPHCIIEDMDNDKLIIEATKQVEAFKNRPNLKIGEGPKVSPRLLGALLASIAEMLADTEIGDDEVCETLFAIAELVHQL